jgi:hypothetical protein
LNLVQALTDPADPINFAPYYMLRPIPGIGAAGSGASAAWPHAILDIHTIGDPYVPIGEGNAFSRAAGLIPFLPPSAAAAYPDYAPYAASQALLANWSGKTPNELLVENGLLEGESRLGRTPAGSTCTVNYVSSASCANAPTPSATTCANSLFDADWPSEGKALFAQQHLAVPLRIARDATELAGDATWAPRATVQPLATTDAMGWKPGAPLGAVMNAYMTPLGQHVWFIGDPCKAWDDVTYMETLLARFIGTGGRDLYYLSHPATHGCMATRTCTF